jgi:hypothetical protein
MNRIAPARWLLVVVAAALVSLLACAPLAYDPPVAQEQVVITTVEPPLPYEEWIPPRPGPNHIWARGHWGWDGARYVWVPGRHVARPQPGVVWVRSGWVRDGRGYRFVPGGWVVERDRPQHHYVHRRQAIHRAKKYRAAPPPPPPPHIRRGEPRRR